MGISTASAEVGPRNYLKVSVGRQWVQYSYNYLRIGPP
jgi:hypothetical protein